MNTKDKNKFKSTPFITEGDSASGSITKARDVQFQAVFSLKGKPLNSFGLTRKVVYENEEFNLIQAALGIEEDLEDLRITKWSLPPMLMSMVCTQSFTDYIFLAIFP